MKMKGFLGFFLILVVFLFFACVLGKECTNVPTELSSHTLRYNLLTSNNESWREETFLHYHVTPTDDSAWLNLMPRKVLREEDEYSWAMMYQTIKNPAIYSIPGGFLKDVSLHDVRLDTNSIHGRAQETNLEYLLILDVDRLVWSFRKTAGLPTPGKPYGGWEAPDVELRGHFVGHYLSATAQMWASTHNKNLEEKMAAVVSALSTCQEKMGTGYLSAFPSEQFDRFENIQPVWAPYYTIHKIMAGLLDQHTYASNPQALKMLTLMVDYFSNRVQNVIAKYTVERHYQSLNEETGGMNDILYKLYAITHDPKHLWLAHLFDKPCFLGLLAVQSDDISGFHANTHIPIVIGSQMRYEVTGDSLYRDIGTYFMDIVNSSHSYATGGTSVDEFWSDPKRLADTLRTETEESCTTYNMLKVSRNLFRWTKEMAYADYYERALTNGVLGVQRGTDPGVMIYMLPLGRGESKAKGYHGWGDKFNSFWCCYGTGIESFSKLGDSIFFEAEGNIPGLYVIQYISSSLDWKSGQLTINQKVDPVVSWDPYLRVTITFSPKKAVNSTLHLRIPTWTLADGVKATLNTQSLHLPAPGNFLSITKKWSSGDKLTLQLPLTLRTEAIKDDRSEYASIQAILYGPYLLAGLTSDDWEIRPESGSLSDWITPIPEDYNSQLVSFSQASGNTTLVITNTNDTLTMEKLPKAGTDSSIRSTFRLVTKASSSAGFSSVEDVIGKSVMLELFDSPGRVVVQQGDDQGLAVDDSPSPGSLFRVVKGLNGKANTVSLESESSKDCLLYTSVNDNSHIMLKLGCNIGEKVAKAASFEFMSGISQYNPISFVAKGMDRNFVLSPLFSMRDESYTVYFDIKD